MIVLAVVVVTCDRPDLLTRALASIACQGSLPDEVWIVSNSIRPGWEYEKEICHQHGFRFLRNRRTANYAGALNSAVEMLIRKHGTSEKVYFASLDDDDEWLPEYLTRVRQEIDRGYDLVASSYLRKCGESIELLALPAQLRVRDFLRGNPGVGGSNTCVRINALLKAGCFDEALDSAVDRDIMVRLLQQEVKHATIPDPLVRVHADQDRPRITTDRAKKLQGLRSFLYKYRFLMDNADLAAFFARAKKLFGLEVSDLACESIEPASPSRNQVSFTGKGAYPLVVGFIAGDETLARRLTQQIIDLSVPVELMVIIDDTKQLTPLKLDEDQFKEYGIRVVLITHETWKVNLANGVYGQRLKRFEEIDSIPLGRSLLQHHLYTATHGMKDPVIWILDDDMLPGQGTSSIASSGPLKFFHLMEQYRSQADALIGGVSNDPPVPTLCCMRGQLVDLLYSIQANHELKADPFRIGTLPDYYYDLSDRHSQHVEMPIYHEHPTEQALQYIFSGKAVSRPVLQSEDSPSLRLTRRGGNTIIFNRQLLRYHPVVNMTIGGAFVRRGDLLWAHFNSSLSGRKFVEHPFAIDQDRPVSSFTLAKELRKAAHDIVGYAINKAMALELEQSAVCPLEQRPTYILTSLLDELRFSHLLDAYREALEHRRARFLMNYLRIVGLIETIAKICPLAVPYVEILRGREGISEFELILQEAMDESRLKTFVRGLPSEASSFSNSIAEIVETETKHRERILQNLRPNGPLRLLGKGAEGMVFTDELLVYKSFFDIEPFHWLRLKELSSSFKHCALLHEISFVEGPNERIACYHYEPSGPMLHVDLNSWLGFLRFQRSHGFVFTNIHPKNFIQLNTGQLKVIDYGKSFEPFREDLFRNMIKRAYLFWRYPGMSGSRFKQLIDNDNAGLASVEFDGWERMLWAVTPRKKERILDDLVIDLIEDLRPKQVLDFGAGKCKLARRISEKSIAVHVHDKDANTLDERRGDLLRYQPEEHSLHGTFDLVLLNIVLCEVDDPAMHEILDQVMEALTLGGHVIVSVCNPDFAHVKRTEFQERVDIPSEPDQKAVIRKRSPSTTRERVEYHRSTMHYASRFRAAGLVELQTLDTQGVNCETLDTASDFKVFVLRRDE